MTSCRARRGRFAAHVRQIWITNPRERVNKERPAPHRPRRRVPLPRGVVRLAWRVVIEEHDERDIVDRGSLREWSMKLLNATEGAAILEPRDDVVTFI